jgi:hypothetical protein
MVLEKTQKVDNSCDKMEFKLRGISINNHPIRLLPE